MSSAPERSGRPSALALIRSQTVYQLRTFTRSPVAMFFTLVLPLVMLILFNAIFGNDTIDTPIGPTTTGQFYVGGLAAFSAVSVLYTGVVNMMPIRRDEGILKRWRGTPLPTWALFAGWITSGVILAAAAVAIQLAFGVVFYGLSIDPAKVPALLLTFGVGAATFAVLGIAVAGLVPNAEAAPAVANATLLPLAFISDVFIPPFGDEETWFGRIGSFFPLKPFATSMQRCLNPAVEAPGIHWSSLAVMAAWGVVGFVVARRTFGWYPSRSAGRSRRRRRRSAADQAA